MAGAPECPTSVTLLGKLRRVPADAVAWEEFVDRYGDLIIGWCRKWGLQEADALDVSQIVLAKLSAKLRTFEYDPSRSFRGWLKTLVHHAWRDLVDAPQWPRRGSGDTRIFAMLQTVEARDDLLRSIEAGHERELLCEAMARVEPRVSPQSWLAFQRLALGGCSGSEVARDLGMSVAAAYMAKSRVQAMLRDEIAVLDEQSILP